MRPSCCSAWAPARFAAAVLAGCLAPAPVAAQDPGLETAVEHFQEQLATVTDSLTLRQWERRLGRGTDSTDTEALRRVHRGLVRLRLGAAGDGWSYGRAAADFGAASERMPEWVFPWYARGMARRAEAEWQARNRLNLGTRVGFGSLEDAVDDFAHALSLDPGYYPAIAALYETAVALRDTARVADIVLPALRAAAPVADDAETWLALGRAERQMGDPARSVTALRRYLERGGNPGLGLRELAWSGFIAGDSGADSAYYAGAAFDDSAAVAAYREELALIEGDSALVEFDAARGDDRVHALHRFWSERAHASLRPPGERLREHYRRISYAERRYGLEVNRRYYHPGDMYRSGSSRFDDRGLVYIRYGEPDQKAATVTFGISPNETWRYHRADGDLLLHFGANTADSFNPGGDLHDLRLIPSIMAIGGVGQADSPATDFAFRDRCAIHEPYCKFGGWGPYGQAKILSQERSIVLASAITATTTDGDEPRFARGLDVAAEAFAVGVSGNRSLVHLVFQVGLAPQDSVVEGTIYRLPLHLRANLVDHEGVTAWIDTVTAILLPGGGPTAPMVEAVGRVTVTVPPGRWRYQLLLAYGDSMGRVLPTDSVDVGDFSGRTLAVSDLVLSRSGRGARWEPAPGDTAYFNPRTTWSRRDLLSLYHEIYGLAEGESYRARLAVRRGRGVVMQLGWEGRAEGPVTRITRTLSFQPVQPGDYQLEMEVIRADGERAVVERRIRVTE